MERSELCRSWQIVYSRYEGTEKQAVAFLGGELCKYLARIPDVYTLFVVPCVKAGEEDPDKNSIVVSTYEESAFAREYVREDEIPACGWVIKTFKLPRATGEGMRQQILITAKRREDLFFAAASFIDDFTVTYAPLSGWLKMPNRFFEYEIADKTEVYTPKVKTRSIFTWGHPINDYREYIRNAARLKINRIILWNDFVPVNAREIVNYAHEFGVRILWGFEWGWGVHSSAHIRSIDDEFLHKLKGQILDRFYREYRDVAEDGIYFQSFTETAADNIGGRRISEAVVKLVNDVSAELLERNPALNIVFGLHASSVLSHLEDIGKTDPRVEILWEDFGAFPSYYLPGENEAESKKLKETTEKLLALRGGKNLGFLFKGFLVLDWERFENQQGPYLLGENTREVTKSDYALRKDAWRIFQAGWITYGENAVKTARQIYDATDGEVEIGMAGCFDGGMWAAEALCAQIITDPHREYRDVLSHTLAKPGITFA